MGAKAVAVMDLLGYKEHLKEHCAEEVLTTLRTRLDKTVRPSAGAGDYTAEQADQPIANRFLVYADTVLFYSSADSPDDVFNVVAEASYFAAMSVLPPGGQPAWELPARGAVAVGDFAADCPDKAQLLGGRAFLEAYEVGQECDWAGCVVCDSVEKFYTERGLDPEGELGEFVTRYEVPCKCGSSKSLLAAKWPELADCQVSDFPTEPCGLAGGALQKYNNTKAFLEAMTERSR